MKMKLGSGRSGDEEAGRCEALGEDIGCGEGAEGRADSRERAGLAPSSVLDRPDAGG
jgi:hypothetical protein